MVRNQSPNDRSRRESITIWSNRVWARRPLDLRAQLLTRQSASEGVLIVQGRTMNLSRGGAGVMVTRELACGSEVVFCAHVPGTDYSLRLRAIVARSQGFRVGLEFVQPTAEQRLLLLRLCQS